LVAYKGPFFNPDNLFVDLDELTLEPLFEVTHFPPLPTTLDPFTAEQIDIIKDDQIISTMYGDCRQYLVHWKGRLESDDRWITREDLQRLTLDFLEFYESLGILLDGVEVLFTPGVLMGASHRFLYVHISTVATVSHRHHFGSGSEP